VCVCVCVCVCFSIAGLLSHVFQKLHLQYKKQGSPSSAQSDQIDGISLPVKVVDYSVKAGKLRVTWISYKFKRRE